MKKHKNNYETKNQLRNKILVLESQFESACLFLSEIGGKVETDYNVKYKELIDTYVYTRFVFKDNYRNQTTIKDFYKGDEKNDK
jgi:hypothetical protein